VVALLQLLLLHGLLLAAQLVASLLVLQTQQVLLLLLLLNRSPLVKPQLHSKARLRSTQRVHLLIPSLYRMH
jgi:hypothetical protein